MADRYLAPSYPGFSIDSYKAGRKLSFLNDAKHKGDRDPFANKQKECDDSNYELESQSSS